MKNSQDSSKKTGTARWMFLVKCQSAMDHNVVDTFDSGSLKIIFTRDFPVD